MHRSGAAAMHGNPRHARPLLVGTALLTRNNYAHGCMKIAALCMIPGAARPGVLRVGGRVNRSRYIASARRRGAAVRSQLGGREG
jgi:hypothetical protein